MIYKVKDILEKLENAIEYKLPFSHIRFGDGGLKFICAMMEGNKEELINISKKEGLPYDHLDEIFDLWSHHARQADFIDSPEVYFNGKFWPRLNMSESTEKKMRGWKFHYYNAEFDNENYCNPESNYLMLIRQDGRKNIFDVIKKRKICIISIFPELKTLLHPLNVDVIKIAPKFQNQFQKSFETVISKIKNKASNYDIWLVAAGELGRIYTGTIKEYNGRAIDIGYVAEVWMHKKLHYRMTPFLKFNPKFPLELILTKEGKKFEDSI